MQTYPDFSLFAFMRNFSEDELPLTTEEIAALAMANAAFRACRGWSETWPERLPGQECPGL
jgi:hypothetical protein